MRRAKRRVQETRHLARHGGRRAPRRRVAARLPRLVHADRKALLLGTALASTLLLGALAAPMPAKAVVPCPQPPGGPIAINVADSIECVNVFDILGAPGTAISLVTQGDGFSITLDNSGNLGAGDNGIFAEVNGIGSPLDILNTGDIDVLNGAGLFSASGRTPVTRIALLPS